MQQISLAKALARWVCRAFHPSGAAGMVMVCFLLVAVTYPVRAQGGKVTISLADTTVVAVLDQLRSQADINFVFNHEELEKCPAVTVFVKHESFEHVLSQVLEDAGLNFKQLNNTYIITPLEKGESMRILRAENRKGLLKGRVVDRDSRRPLSFATVVVLTTEPFRGASTDADGYFSLENLPVGRHTLRISYVGYRNLIRPEIFVGSARETFITCALSEKTEEIGELDVGLAKGEPLNQMATVSARSFSVEETRRYAASISDPARMVQVFAGVTVNDDATNEIVIRGNSPNWVLWRLEGVEIPSPNHFSEEGYTSGAVSILSSDLLTTSDFYTGAFPAEFGNALSGVFDLRLRNGNSERHEYSFQAGVLGLDLSAEGPFNKNYEGSYLVNYRYSTLSLLNKFNVEVSKNALPNYQDLSFKINLPTKKAGVFSIWGLGGNSNDHKKYIPDVEQGENPLLGYTDFTSSGMYAAGVTHTLFPDENSYIRTVLSRSSNYSGETFENMDSQGRLKLSFEDDLNNKAYRASIVYNRKQTQHLTLRSGFTFNNMNFAYLSTLADSTGAYRTFLNGSGRTNLLQAYFQSKYKFSERILLTAGLHYAYFALSDDHSLEPRLGMIVNLPQHQRLSFGYGRHSKNEPLPTYFVETPDEQGAVSYPNIGLALTRASHFVLGYDKNLGDDLHFNTEIYYQFIQNLPVPTNEDKYFPPSFGGAYPDDTLANIGQARNYGFEITFQKYFTNSYYILITGSFFSSRYQAANGKWYDSRYNVKRITNFVGGKEFRWGSNKMIGIDTKIIWTGGRRMLSLDLPASIAAGNSVYDISKVYSTQAPDYFRIDLGVNLRFFRSKTEHIISLDVQNLTNRKNILAEEYNPIMKDLDYYRMVGIIPIMAYRVEF